MKTTVARLCLCAVGLIAAYPLGLYGLALLESCLCTGGSIQEQISWSDNVAWLERIAVSSEFAKAISPAEPELHAQPKDLRIAAYARLGALATAESIRAQKRIAAALSERSLLPTHVPLDAKWSHPAWHWADDRRFVRVETHTDDGQRIVILLDDMLGPPHLFLMRCGPTTNAACTRPVPVTPWIFGYVKFDPSLEPLGDGRLRLRIEPRAEVQKPIPDFVPPSLRPPLTPAAETYDFVIADVERDSDHDGWTDIEERLLGLDPLRADSDGDGIDDGHDRSPGYAPSAVDAADDDVAILQQAIFAAFGLSESRRVLFAKNENVRRMQLWGLGAPVLFNRPLIIGDIILDPPPGGIFVSWRILEKTDAEAIVEIDDWEDALAGGGQEVILRRINGEWMVVERRTTFVA